MYKRMFILLPLIVATGFNSYADETPPITPPPVVVNNAPYQDQPVQRLKHVEPDIGHKPRPAEIVWPSIENPKNSKQVYIWKKCQLLSKIEKQPYRYGQGILINKEIVLLPTENSDPYGFYALEFAYGDHNDTINIGIGGKNSQLKELTSELVEGKAYAFCFTYSNALLQRGILEFNTKKVYPVER